MKNIISVLFSSATALVLLIIFAASIGSATFIEQTYDTNTAKILVYNAKWFELILLLLAVNMIGHIVKYKMFKWEKAASVTFHLAFILLIVGAAVSRYIGYEGSMHIRERHASNIIYNSIPALQIEASGKNFNYRYSKQLIFGSGAAQSFSREINAGEFGKVTVSVDHYIPNAVQKIDSAATSGKSILKLVLAGAGARQDVLLEEGETTEYGNSVISYNATGTHAGINLVKAAGKLTMVSHAEIMKTSMQNVMSASDSGQLFSKDSAVDFSAGNLYKTADIMIMLMQEYPRAAIKMVQGAPGEEGTEMLLVNVAKDGKQEQVPLFTGSGMDETPKELNIDGLSLKLSYGNQPVQLPFSLNLNKFILDRYAGSMSPSSYASEVTLVDNRTGLKKDSRIFMNNVLDYDGYRFFQSSYDRDQKGTILSVNHDFYGTWISYVGYMLLALGFVLALMNRNSRFRSLSRKIRSLQADRKAGLAAMLFLAFAFGSYAQNPESARKPVSRQHADMFGRLLVQTYDGRFEPMHTLATDLVHKISRKDLILTDTKGELDGPQVVLDMLLDPNFWKQQKIVYVKEASVQKILGVDGKYACFNDFLENGSKYKLATYAEEAFRKRASEQNTFDKEIIRLDERLNVFMTVFNGTVLKIFPLQGSANHEWISLIDTMTRIPLTGKLKEANLDLNLEPLSYDNMIRFYMQSLFEATQSGDYTKADQLLQRFSNLQRTETPADLLPTQSKVDLEIYYNKSQIFISLRNWYGILGLILIILAFIENFRKTRSKPVTWLFYGVSALLVVAFLSHTGGMALRWYLSGHAPWSNGYEALLLAAWGSLLAGFYFVRYSKITLAATAILACSMLMTAGHSSYDPQLTNLQPVLKSYWLIIHVAVITISYGFLALGFVLGLINLLLLALRRTKNFERITSVLTELTMTNEMALSIGIVMATVGTFLGGVWANESWGRYWGWDSKETWALVIVITYAIVLHLRFVKKISSLWLFNTGSVIGFGSVLMTFIGVNYYLTKGMHSYASGDTPVFPVWAWIAILSLVLLIIFSGLKSRQKT